MEHENPKTSTIIIHTGLRVMFYSYTITLIRYRILRDNVDDSVSKFHILDLHDLDFLISKGKKN